MQEFADGAPGLIDGYIGVGAGPASEFAMAIPLKEKEALAVMAGSRSQIAIANSDAGASAYTDVAIDQAWRAVGELLHGLAAPPDVTPM